jgi:hypothetical protein
MDGIEVSSAGTSPDAECGERRSAGVGASGVRDGEEAAAISADSVCCCI